MEPFSPRSVNNKTNQSPSLQQEAPRIENKSDKNVQPSQSTAPYIPSPTIGDPASSRQRLLQQIHQTHTTSPADTVAYSATLNTLLLAEGITEDDRLVNTQPSTTRISSLPQRQDDVSETDEDDEFYDAYEELPAESDKKTVQPGKDTIASRVLNAAKSLTGAPALYKKLLNKAARLLASRAVKGIEGEDINQLLVAINQVHTQHSSQTLHLDRLTFPALGPSYHLSNATVTIHEVSVPNPETGYHQIRVKISISADAEYPSPTGDIVSGHLQLNEALIDINFAHDQVIKKLLTSANVVTTAAKLFGSIVYSKLPGIPGWQRLKNWAGWHPSSDAPSSPAAPSLKNLLLPTSFTLRNVDIQAALHSKAHPELQAKLCFKGESMEYDFTEKPGYLNCKNTKISLRGDQCAKIMPFTLKKELAEQLPFFQHDHTHLNVNVPDLVLKNGEDNHVVVIPEAFVESEGDITLHKGHIEDARVGLFKQSTGSLITAVKAKRLSADHMVIPTGSLGLPFTEEGAVDVKGANLTFVQSPIGEATPASTLIQQEGLSLYQRIKGWVGLNKTSAPTFATDIKEEKEEKSNTLFTFSADTVEANIHGSISFDGTLEKTGVMVSSQEDKVHLTSRQLSAQHLGIGQPAKSDTQDGEMKAPVSAKGHAKNIHLVAHTEAKSGQSLLDIDLEKAHLDVSAPVATRGTSLEKLHVAISQPHDQHVLVQAKGSKAHSGTLNIKALNGDGNFHTDEVQLDSHIYSRPATQAEKDTFEKFWQKPQTHVRQITTDIKTDAINGELTPLPITAQDSDDAPPTTTTPLVEDAYVTTPAVHVDISETTGEEGIGALNVVTGTISAGGVYADGHLELKQFSRNSQRILEAFQKISEEMPELEEAFIAELKEHGLEPDLNKKEIHTTAATHFNVTAPVLTFGHQNQTLEADAAIPEIRLSIDDGPVNLAAQVNTVKGHHNSTKDTSTLAIDKINLEKLGKQGTFVMQPVEGQSTLGTIEHVTLYQQKYSDEDQTLEVHADKISAKAGIEHTASEHADKRTDKANTQNADHEQTQEMTPLALSLHNTDFTKADHQQGSDLHLNIEHATVVTQTTKGDETLTDTLNIDTLTAAANLYQDKTNLAANAAKVGLQSKGIVNADITLKDIGATVERTATSTKICPHIDKEQSGLQFNHLPRLIQFLNEKNNESTSSQALPVDLSLTPHLDPGDELTGTISAECKGNVGKMFAYAQRMFKGKGARIFCGVCKHVFHAMDFKISVARAPLKNGKINIGNLMKHVSVDVSFKGWFSWLFKPALILAQGVLGFTLNKRFTLLSQSDMVDTQGYVSLTQLLAKHNIRLTEKEEMPAISIPVTTSPVRTALNHLRLHQPLPSDWDEESFLAGIITELEKIYGKDAELKQELMAFALQFLDMYGCPKTMDSFEKVIKDLNRLKRSKEAHPEMKRPPRHYFKGQLSPRLTDFPKG